MNHREQAVAKTHIGTPIGASPGSFLTLAGPIVDYAATGVRVDEWILDNYDLPLITGILMTSVLGVLVNITAYWAIKTTGAVTYQVSGL